MLHKAWSSIEEVPYCFSRSSIKFQGHTALKFVEFDPNWAFLDCNSNLNSPMAMKCCTKLETAKERCPIIFQGHTSNFKVTRDKTSPILTQIGRFRTIGRSQLSNPSDLPCYDMTKGQQFGKRIHGITWPWKPSLEIVLQWDEETTIRCPSTYPTHTIRVYGNHTDETEYLFMWGYCIYGWSACSPWKRMAQMNDNAANPMK